MLEFCCKMIYILPGNRAYIYNEIEHKKPLPKPLDIINTEVLIKSVFYVNNLTLNQELNTWCEIIHIKSRLHQNYSLHGLTPCTFYKQANLFRCLSKSVYKHWMPFVFVSITFFSTKVLFVYLFLLIALYFSFGFVCLYLIYFCQIVFLSWFLEKILGFSLFYFLRLINLETFKEKQLAILLASSLLISPHNRK